MKGTLQKEARNTPEVQRPTTTEFVAPVVNIFETKEGYVLEAEMPGVTKQGLEVTLEGTELTITGHRQQNEQPGRGTLFRECAKSDYRRVFELDPAIDTTRIQARMDQGVLTLTLPKSEAVKPRKITVD